MEKETDRTEKETDHTENETDHTEKETETISNHLAARTTEPFL